MLSQHPWSQHNSGPQSSIHNSLTLSELHIPYSHSSPTSYSITTSSNLKSHPSLTSIHLQAKQIGDQESQLSAYQPPIYLSAHTSSIPNTILLHRSISAHVTAKHLTVSSITEQDVDCVHSFLVPALTPYFPVRFSFPAYFSFQAHSLPFQQWRFLFPILLDSMFILGGQPRARMKVWSTDVGFYMGQSRR
jgi:hypothetical protein